MQSLPNITLIISILALLAGSYSLWQIFSLNRLRKSFFAGTQALNLENVILALKQELQDSRLNQSALEQALAELKNKQTFSVQKVGLVRFNPFNDGGGNFSFSLALLDQNNSGVILTSMYGREQNRIYTKKIDLGMCDSKLTEEEERAVTIANTKPEEKKPKRKFRE